MVMRNGLRRPRRSVMCPNSGAPRKIPISDDAPTSPAQIGETSRSRLIDSRTTLTMPRS
jgi:hypothetical protein